MAVEDDVLVVGGGLAGMTAALSAARTGAQVRLVSGAESSLHQASGLVDVLGYVDGELQADPYAGIPALAPDHPYRRVGPDAVRAGLALFDDVTEGYRGDHTDRNALVPTHGGTVKPTARYPAGTAAGLASDERDCLLVGFERLTDFDAPLVAANLGEAAVPFRVRGACVQFPRSLPPDAAATRYARALDRDEDGVRDALARAVDAVRGDAARVGFPAVLGRDRPAAVRADIAATLGVDVFEVPMGPPSLPGIRLAERFEDRLRDADVRLTKGSPVVDVTARDGRVETVSVDRGRSGGTFRAGQYVLATGGLVGGGVTADRERVREPVFDCHVAHPDDRADWSAADAFGDHAFARFGLAVEDDLRPRDAGGRVEFANLRAAGAVLGGADFAAEKSGSGISLATGHRAGTLAGEAV